jgi:alkylation response protein AidB-like acyl-CoA dehydrogenase
MNYFDDEKEWLWLFEHAIDWQSILPLYPVSKEYSTQEEALNFFRELLSATGAWAGSSVLERAEKLDKEGAGKIENGKTIPGEALSEFYKEAMEMQAFGIPVSEKYGGMELPMSIYSLVVQQLSQSCISSSTQYSFHSSSALMVDFHGTEEMRQKYINQIVNGQLSGSMNMTEPHCGSDVGAIRTQAVHVDGSVYELTGSKIFITNGGGGVAVILARVKGDEEGLGGLSLFLMPQKWEENETNYMVAKNEHKMGMHGSFTCEVVFEKSKAWLLGEQGKGFKYMLHMMNEARILTGMQALGGIEGSLRYAMNYANERNQFDKPISELPLMKRNLHEFAVERDALRAFMADSISWFDIHYRLDFLSHSKELSQSEKKLFKQAGEVIRRRTPLVKYFCCEAFTRLSTKAIQVLGGYGFMQEYPVERYHRDSFGPLLYEGTSQIQALMAYKDYLKMLLANPTRLISGLIFSTTEYEYELDSSVKGNVDSLERQFQRNMSLLIFRRTRQGQYNILDKKQVEEMANELCSEAENICQVIGNIEILKVLAYHATKCQSRLKLFHDFEKLAKARLASIYQSWDD